MGKSLNIKKGDTVKVIAGKDKGAEGKVITVLREQQRVVEAAERPEAASSAPAATAHPSSA